MFGSNGFISFHTMAWHNHVLAGNYIGLITERELSFSFWSCLLFSNDISICYD